MHEVLRHQDQHKPWNAEEKEIEKDTHIIIVPDFLMVIKGLFLGY